MAKMKAKRTDSKELVPCLVGITISMITAIILTAIMTIFINNEYIDIKLYRLIAAITHFVSVFMGVYLTLLLLKPPYYVAIIISSVVYVFALCTSLLFFEGLSVNAAIALIPYGIGSILAVLLDKKGRSRHSKRHCRTRSR